MNIQNFINDWIAVSNSFNTNKYLDFYQPGAVLDDPSVGKKFAKHEGIKDYFESYFIGYQTQTRLVDLQVKDGTAAHLEVEFTGQFPGGKVGGTFDFIFKDDKIAFIKADLLN